MLLLNTRRRRRREALGERMSGTVEPSVTELLHALGAGDEVAAQELLARVYNELKAIARGQLGGAPSGKTLQATALVNEACLRLLGGQAVSWENRRHFFFVAARAMRDILVDEARRKAAAKRGGGWHRVDVDRLELAVETPAAELLALDEALQRLAEDDERMAQIVRLRFFAGLTEGETAAAMQLSSRTIRREWRYIRARLYRELSGDTRGPSPNEASAERGAASGAGGASRSGAP